MLDRSVQFPQRYQMKKVEGTEDIFDLIPAPGEVSSEGTLINKATLWKDATAALFGLGVDSVPDDGFAYLGKYAQHWWRRRTPTETPIHRLKIIDGSGKKRPILYSPSSTYSYDVPYSENPEYEAGNEFVLEKTVNFSYSTYTKAEVLKGKYVYYVNQGNPDKSHIYYVDPTSEITAERESFYLVYASNVFDTEEEVITFPPNEWQYVQSSDRSSYPDSGEQDGYEYEYLGIPFDNAVGAPGIEAGSYTGTGTYGVDNPNSLTFEFVPELVIVLCTVYSTPPYQRTKLGLFSKKYGATIQGDSQVKSYYILSQINSKTLTWYSNGYNASAGNQLNESNVVYNYIAIG